MVPAFNSSFLIFRPSLTFLNTAVWEDQPWSAHLSRRRFIRCPVSGRGFGRTTCNRWHRFYLDLQSQAWSLVSSGDPLHACLQYHGCKSFAIRPQIILPESPLSWEGLRNETRSCSEWSSSHTCQTWLEAFGCFEQLRFAVLLQLHVLQSKEARGSHTRTLTLGVGTSSPKRNIKCCTIQITLTLLAGKRSCKSM